MDSKKVDIASYVKEGLENGTLTPVVAEKFARIIAVQGNVGDIVTSWSESKEGNEIQEKKDEKVILDEKTNEPGWIATKVDENGEVKALTIS